MTCRHLAVLAAGMMFAAGLAGQARAQQTTTDHGDRAQLDEIRKVSALRKADILNQANEKIASVSDLILTQDGKVQYAVLSVGGVVGIGAKYTAIPWEKLDIRHVNNKWAVNLPMTKETLEHAPLIESDNYRELANAQWVSRMREYFATQLGPAATREGDRKATSPEAATTLYRASKILGAALRNAQSENLGSVADLLLDRNSKVAFAIVGHGGVLGIGENYIPVPWSKLSFTDREDTGLVATINSNKDQLEKAPLVKGDTYATMLAPGFTEQVYRFFGTEKP